MTCSTCITSGQCRVKVAAITVGQAASHTELHGASVFLQPWLVDGLLVWKFLCRQCFGLRLVNRHDEI